LISLGTPTIISFSLLLPRWRGSVAQELFLELEVELTRMLPKSLHKGSGEGAKKAL